MRTLNWITLLITLFCIGTGALAQPELEPIIMIGDNTVWRWTQADGINAIATLPENREALTVSPTREWLVYEVLTDAVVRTIEEECPCGGPTKWATDLTIIDLTTGETSLLDGTPETEVSLGTIHSNLLWSPDGTQIAWAEGLEYGDLAIYDLATATKTIVATEIPSQYAVSSPVELAAWVDAGIIIEQVDFVSGIRQGYAVYSPVDGSIVAELPPVDSGFRVVTYNNMHMLLVDGQLVNPRDGSVQTAPNGMVVQFAAHATDTSLRVMPPVQLTDGTRRYDVTTSDGSPYPTSGAFPYLSPSGQAILYHQLDTNTILIQQGDNSIEFDMPTESGSIYWGQQKSMLVEGGETLIIGTRCEGTLLTFRLRTDDNAYVLGTTPNNVRSSPNINSDRIGQIPAGDWFPVLDGPTCADGYAWWQVQYGGFTGWTVEGQEAEYFLAPGCPEDVCARG